MARGGAAPFVDDRWRVARAAGNVVSPRWHVGAVALDERAEVAGLLAEQRARKSIVVEISNQVGHPAIECVSDIHQP